jgi:hypothetical protein
MFWVFCKEKRIRLCVGVIRISKWKQDRQHNGLKKKDQRTNNDLQNNAQNTKAWSTRTSHKNRSLNNNTTRVTSRTGNANPSDAHEFIPRFLCEVLVDQALVFCALFCRSLLVLWSFFFRPLCCLSCIKWSRSILLKRISNGLSISNQMKYYYILPPWELIYKVNNSF